MPKKNAVKAKLEEWRNTEDDTILNQLDETLYNAEYMAEHFRCSAWSASDVIAFATSLITKVSENFKEYDT